MTIIIIIVNAVPAEPYLEMQTRVNSLFIGHMCVRVQFVVVVNSFARQTEECWIHECNVWGSYMHLSSDFNLIYKLAIHVAAIIIIDQEIRGGGGPWICWPSQSGYFAATEHGSLSIGNRYEMCVHGHSCE